MTLIYSLALFWALLLPPTGLSNATAVSAAVAPAQAQSATRPSAVMMRYPDVSQHSIVFRYAGDLWIVGKDGGQARRISSAPGGESFAKFSPDGTQLAFMAAYDGEPDLYVMPVEGGVPTRVTHHPDTEVFCDWHADGERLLYYSTELSGQRRAPKLFLVPALGGHPELLPLAYGTFGSIDPTGSRLAYTPTSREFSTWKRYRGGLAQDIWIFDLTAQTAQQITDHPGTDAIPMWHGASVVFLSDRGLNSRMNLFSFDTDTGETRQLTTYETTDIRFPSMGPEDVVFENGGKLFRYSFASEEVVPVEVLIPGDRPALRVQTHGVASLARNLHLGPGAKRIALEARGEVFTLPVEQGFVRNLTTTSRVAERSPRWSPDGRWIAYLSDRTGEYELTVRQSDGRPFTGADEHGERTLTSLGPGWKSHLQWSPDSARLSFASNDGGLFLVELETAEVQRVTTHPSGSPLSCDWSAGSDWLTWSHRHSESRLSAIYLFDVAERRAHEVTSGMFDDRDPCFDRDGEWLYFQSSRTFDPSHADLDTTWIYDQTSNLMAVPLRARTRLPWGPRNDEETFEATAAESADADGSDPEQPMVATTDETPGSEAETPMTPEGDAITAAEQNSTPAPQPQIDLEGFESRVTLLPVKAGEFEGLAALSGKLLYLRRSATGDGQLMLFDRSADADMEASREQLVLDGVDRFSVNATRDRVLVSSADHWSVVEPAEGQTLDDPIAMTGLSVDVDPRAEWAQLVDDVWRIFRDFFYDPNLHGVDWNAIHERTLTALGDATSREDVHFLIGEMMAELNVGHAYNRGAPEPAPEHAPGVGLLGCNWAVENDAYRIARVLAGGAYDADARSPLAAPGVDAKENDYLLAVNGRPIDVSQDVHAAFGGTAGLPTMLTLNANPTTDGTEREVLVVPVASERALRYRDWVRRKREYVTLKSAGRIGFVHVPDTGDNGQNELMRQILGQMHEPALIVDERWNAGGRVPTRFIELLDRPLTNFFAVRHGEDMDWPPVGHRGPKAMLINHASGSGGDAFPYYFRQAGLGKLVGTRTWGGLVGISDNPTLIDGARVSVPRFAFYELDGTWGIEGYGVEPDLEVIDDPATMLHGDDPQLDAAIESLLADLTTWPVIQKTRPAGPDRSGAGIPQEER